MYFISELRYNPKTQHEDYYYRIKESFCDLAGRPRLMLTVGFIEEKVLLMFLVPFNFWQQNYSIYGYPLLCKI